MKISHVIVLSSFVIMGAGLVDAAAKKDTRNPIIVIQTKLGTIEVELYPQEAPETVQNFLSKVKKEYFDGTTFHRLVPGFVIQGGDPLSKDSDLNNDGFGGGQMPAEPRKLSSTKGTIAMASSSRKQPIDSQSDAQFFINLADNKGLDAMGFIPFGKVIKGIEVAENIVKQPRNNRDRPLKNITMKIVIKN